MKSKNSVPVHGSWASLRKTSIDDVEGYLSWRIVLGENAAAAASPRLHTHMKPLDVAACPKVGSLRPRIAG